MYHILTLSEFAATWRQVENFINFWETLIFKDLQHMVYFQNQELWVLEELDENEMA